MKQTKLMRMLAFILVIVMMLEMGPMQVFATGSETTPETAGATVSEETVSAETSVIPEVYIEGEVTELRSEYEKHYRLTDGSFMAVQYQVPVHYEDDGQWVDIDNTLEPVTMFSGNTVYQAVNGENVQAFAADLSDGTIMTMANSDHMISMSIWTYDSTEDAVVEDETDNSVIVEDNTVETEPAATQESFPEEPVDSAEASEVSNADNNLVSDLAFVEEEDPEMSMLSVDETEIVQEDATIEEQQDDTIVAQILTEEVDEDPVADTEEAEHWELDDVMPDALSSSILYEDVFPGVDLRYDTFSYNVKESIILKQQMDLNEYTYSFLLTLDGLDPELQEDGSIILLDDAYEVQYTIPAPYMWDAENVYSDAVFYQLEETEDGWVLTVCADESWLEDEERAYPVTIDPSVNLTTNIRYTTSVQTGTPNSNSDPARPARLSCGYSTTFGRMNGYVRLTELPQLPVGCTVTSAKIHPISASHWLNTNCRMDVYMLTSEVSDWSRIIPWGSQPQSAEIAMDFIMASEDTDGYFSPNDWDITPAFMQWMNDPESNFGLKLVGVPDKSNESSWVRFHSTETYMTVTYRNTVGTESYYTYETQSAVRAGTGYVGDFSSALTVFKTDISYSSATTPFSVGHVFNSSLRGKELDSFDKAKDTFAPDYSKMKTGNGWQLSVQESVKQTTINTIRYLVYRDGDGTLHYFKNSSGNTYVDEDGLGLKITQGTAGSDVGYTMVDQSGTERYFRNGYLKYIKDTNGNKICFLYNNATYSDTHSTWHPPTSGAYLTSIVAARNEKPPQTICTFQYSNNRLSSITDYAGRVTSYTYDANGNLTKVTHPDKTEAQYTYSSTGHLTGMYDAEAKYGIEYTYVGDGVATIQEYAYEGSNKVVGTRLKREKPSIQETVYRYDGNDRQFVTENAASKDDIVNRYAFDYAGRTINAVTLDTNEERILGVSAAAYKASSSDSPAANNRISKTGQSGQNSVNLLKNSGLEFAYASATNNEWKSVTTQVVNYTGEISTENARTGLKALKSTIKPTASENHRLGRVGGMYQPVNLKANTTYTFSAYVNTNGVDDFSTGSVYAAFLTSNNGIIVSGNKITYKTGEEIDGGWQRIYCTYRTGSNDETGRVGVIQENVFGTVYYDDLQLEVGDVPSTANLLQDATFNIQTSYWSGENYSYKNDSGDPHHPNVLSINGEATAYRRVSQRVKIEQVCTDQTFLLSGWGKAASGADCKTSFNWSYGASIDNNHESRYYGLIARAWYKAKDGGEHAEYFFMPFNDDYDGWQFASCVIVPDSYYQKEQMTLKYIDVYVVYDRNFNTMYVDNLSLRQEPCTSYTYNSEGGITAVNATGNSAQSVVYKDDNVRPATVYKTDDEIYIYRYDASNEYLPAQITNHNTGVYTRYTYDSFGNVTMTENARCRISDSNRISDYYIRSFAEYSDDGSQLVSETNGNGQKTTYTYTDDTRLVYTVKDAKNTVVISRHNALNDRNWVNFIDGEVSVEYAYKDGMMSQIDRGGYITENGVKSAKQEQFYNLSYDAFGNMTEVSIGGKWNAPNDAYVLATYDYGDTNGHLNSMAYGNGDGITYDYDELDRLTEEEWNDGTSYLYSYNSDGGLSKKVDTNTGNTVNYEYDSIGRLIHSSLSDEDGTVLRTEHMYDRQNRIKEQSWQIGDSVYTDTYSYRGSDGTIESQLTSIGNNLSWAYDDIARVEKQSNGVFDVGYTYRNLTDTRTTTQISRVSYTGADNSLVEFTLDYTYDAVGNITSVTGTSDFPFLDATYEYDIQGQLTKESLSSGVRNYEYDTYGNIRRVSGARNHTYTYGDADWKDLLTAYDGQTITYDEIGNPLSYYNGTRWTFDWEKGRQLVSAESDDHEISYTYDMAGIRDSKTVDGITYHYYTLSGKLMRQTWEDANGTEHVIDFCYDAAGRPFSMKYDGLILYYMLNQQGDVIRLINSDGASYGIYQYDAWGNILYSTNNKWLNNNPIRYRGYIYDTETGFYYLQSRYYDPSIGRFINADSFASTGQGFIGINTFAYCNNSPVSYFDPNGFAAMWTNLVVDKGGNCGGSFYVPPSSAGKTNSLLEIIGGSLAASYVFADAITKPEKKENDYYTVYFLKAAGDINNDIIYVGRVKTANLSSRMSYHNKCGRELVFRVDGLNYAECRYLEQAGMIWCHTISSGPLNNKIRGISPTNPNRFTYFAAGKKLSANGSWLESVFPISYWANQTENMLLNGSP